MLSSLKAGSGYRARRVEIPFLFLRRTRWCAKEFDNLEKSPEGAAPGGWGVRQRRLWICLPDERERETKGTASCLDLLTALNPFPNNPLQEFLEILNPHPVA